MSNRNLNRIYTDNLKALFYPLKKLVEDDPEGVKREYRDVSCQSAERHLYSFSYAVINDSGEKVLYTESFTTIQFDGSVDEEDYILYEKRIGRKYSSFVVFFDWLDAKTYIEFYNFVKQNYIKQLRK